MKMGFLGHKTDEVNENCDDQIFFKKISNHQKICFCSQNKLFSQKIASHSQSHKTAKIKPSFEFVKFHIQLQPHNSQFYFIHSKLHFMWHANEGNKSLIVSKNLTIISHFSLPTSPSPLTFAIILYGLVRAAISA
jgi:hypothetical protein